MGIWQYASRTTSQNLVTGSLTMNVAGGEPIQVCGILFDNNTGASIRITINNAAEGTAAINFIQGH